MKNQRGMSLLIYYFIIGFIYIYEHRLNNANKCKMNQTSKSGKAKLKKISRKNNLEQLLS